MTVLLVEAPLKLQPPRILSRSRSPSPSAEREETKFLGSGSCVDLSADSIRARRILETEIQYIDHPSFVDPGARDAILSPMPEPPQRKGTHWPKLPSGLSTYLTTLWAAPLLSREQEGHLFRKMNYLKYLAGRLRDRIDPDRPARPIWTRSTDCKPRP